MWGLLSSGGAGGGLGQDGRKTPEKNSWNAASSLSKGDTNRSFVRRGEIFRGECMFFFFFFKWSLVLLQVNTTFLSCQVTEWCYERVGPVFLPRNLWAPGRSSVNISLRVCVTRWISTSPKGTFKFKACRFITPMSTHLADLPSGRQTTGDQKVASRSCLNDVMQIWCLFISPLAHIQKKSAPSWIDFLALRTFLSRLRVYESFDCSTSNGHRQRNWQATLLEVRYSVLVINAWLETVATSKENSVIAGLAEHFQSFYSTT